MKKLSLWFLSLLGKHKYTAFLTLNTLSFICRLFPDRRWKDFVRSAVEKTKWKECTLPFKMVKVEGVRVKIRPHLNEFDVDALFRKNFTYESELYSFLSRKIEHYDLVIDIGANIGLFSLFAAKASPGLVVVSFEPSSKAYFRLTENINENKIQNILAYNAAVSNSDGFIRFYEPENHLTNGSINQKFADNFSSNVKESQVLCVSADKLEFFITNSTKVLFKIDVEGAEDLILKAIENLAKGTQCDIILEVLKPFEDSLNKIDYVFSYFDIFNITKDGLIKMDRFVGNDEYRDYYLTYKKNDR